MPFQTFHIQCTSPIDTKPTSRRGFTLVEVMVTVAIIALLVTIGTFSWREVSRRGQASKIASDFRKIEGAWQVWRTDTHLAYPNEQVFDSISNPGGVERTDAAGTMYCNEESFIGETSLFADIGATSTNWRGPYLNIEPRDHTQRHYAYDNDSDPWVESCNTLSSGVNIQLSFCPEASGEYMQIAPIVDRAIDGTTTGGECTGKFRWSTTAPFAFLYLIDTN